MLVMFFTVDGEGTARNISERHTLLHISKVGSRKKRRNRKTRNITHLGKCLEESNNWIS